MKYSSAYNHLAIEVDSKFNDITKGELALKIRTDIRPTHHTKQCGVVIGLPREWRDDIHPDGDVFWSCKGVSYEIGDKVYFNYNAVLDKQKEIAENIFMVPARKVYLKISNGVIMSHGFSLCERVYSDNVIEIELEGKRMMVEVSPITQIIMNATPKPIARHYRIKHSNDHVENSEVLTLDDNNMEIEVEGEVYYLVENIDILGVL